MAPAGSESELVEAVRRGAPGAFDDLYARHRAGLYGYLVRSLGQRAAADDVFQEVWIKVYESLNRFDPSRGTFRAWLYRVATNAVIDRVRHDRLRRMAPLDGEPGSEEAAPPEPVSPAAGPERRVAARERLRQVEAALEELPPAQRSAVLLRHHLGLSYEDVAHALSAPVGTAKALVHRGVYALRAALPEGEELIDGS